MKSLSNLGLEEKGSFKFYSNLAGIAIDLGASIYKDNRELGLALSELALSYQNSRIMALLSYGRAAYQHKIVKESKKEPYELIQFMSECCHLFITSAKSSLDIGCCIVDLIVSRTPKQENKLPDLKFNTTSPIINHYLEELRQLEWVNSLVLTRNRIVHRGFSITFDEVILGDKNLQPYISRKNLSWTGTQSFTVEGFEDDGRGNVRACLDLQSLIQGFVQDIPAWEKRISQAFIDDKLIDEITDYEALRGTFSAAGSSFMVHRGVGQF